MSTIVMYFAGFIILLMVLDRIAGLKHLIKPVIDFISFIVTTICTNIGAWLMWMLKTLGRSHYVLAVHLVRTRDDLDPTEQIIKANKRGGVPSYDE